MNEDFNYTFGNIKITFSIFDEFVKKVEQDFVPPLYARINIKEFFVKLSKNAVFVHCWNQCQLIALMALYCNDQKNKKSYIPFIAVRREYRGKNIATNILKMGFEIAKERGMQNIGLDTKNDYAYQCYLKSGFKLIDVYLIENGIKRYYLEKKL